MIAYAWQTFWTNLVLRRGAELSAEELGAIHAEHADVDEKDEARHTSELTLSLILNNRRWERAACCMRASMVI